jgi:hypothetical protein
MADLADNNGNTHGHQRVAGIPRLVDTQNLNETQL